MDITQAIVLAFLQGLTEFLPISSSAHLILLPVLLEWEDQGLAFDVAVHVGTLMAVMAYYAKDLKKIILGWLKSICQRQLDDDGRLAWYVGFASIPVGIAGLSMNEEIQTVLRTPLSIALATILFAILLWYSEKKAKEINSTLNMKDAILIGCFQALALIPGTSRSGITITAGLLTGLKKTEAARFSFLLSVPAISMSGLLKGLELVQSSVPVQWDLITIGVVLSAFIAYISISAFLKLLEKIGMMPFVIYRIVLGGFLIAVFF